jgi:hypothetical protein
MLTVTFIAMPPSLVVAALTPAKVTDVQTDPSATPGVKTAQGNLCEEFFYQHYSRKIRGIRRR